MTGPAPDPNLPSGAGRWVGRLLLAAAFSFVALTRIQTISAPDFWSHLASGRALAQHGTSALRDTLSYTAAGQTIRSTGWLYDRALYALWQLGGATLVTLAHAVIFLSAAALALRAAARWVTPGAPAAAAVALAGSVAAFAGPVSPAVFAALAIAVFLHELSRNRSLPRLALTLIGVQILWANVDASFLLGPALALLGAVDFWLEHRSAGGLTSDERARCFAMLGLAGALALATWIHPVGPSLWGATIGDWRDPPAPGFRVWISPIAHLMGSTLFRNLLIALLLIGAAGLVSFVQRLPALLTGAALAGSLLALRAAHTAPLAALLALPFLALALHSLARVADRRTEHPLPNRLSPLARGGAITLAVALIAASAMLVLGYFHGRTGSLSHFGVGTEERLYPSVAASLLDQPGFPARTLHLPFDGGYLAWRHPSRAICCDLRRGLYDREMEQLIGRWSAGDSGVLETLIRRLRAEALVLNCLWPTASRLAREAVEAGWHLIYFDGVTAVFLPRPPGETSFVVDPVVREAGLVRLDREVNDFAAQLRRGRRPALAPAVVGGAELFAALERPGEAADLYAMLAKVVPHSTYIGLQLGIAQCKAGRLDSAITSLEAATAREPDNGLAWFWLAQAYKHAGRDEEAKRAAATADRWMAQAPK